MTRTRALAVAACLAAAPAPGLAATFSDLELTAFGTFDIQLSFDPGVRQTTRAFFAEAEAYWERIIRGYRTPALGSGIAALVISVSEPQIDGTGGILGGAGATLAATDGTFFTPTAGLMEFDRADVDGLIVADLFDDVIRHEMAHVIGFAPNLWELNPGILDPQDALAYLGPFGLEAYRREFDPGAAFVPLENAGGSGTAFAHWDEQNFGDFGSSGDNPELMTGFLNPNSTYLSQTTVFSFQDIGYAVIALPLPPAGWMLLAGIGALALAARRGRRAGVDSPAGGA